MPELQLKSGAKAVINPAGFREAMSLKNAIVKEISGSDIKFDLSAFQEQSGNEKRALEIGQVLMTQFLSVFLKVDSSPLVYDALLPCLARCTYNSEKIKEETFENEKAREDYYDIVIACVEANMTPFFKSLVLRLKPLLKSAKSAIPASE